MDHNEHRSVEPPEPCARRLAEDVQPNDEAGEFREMALSNGHSKESPNELVKVYESLHHILMTVHAERVYHHGHAWLSRWLNGDSRHFLSPTSRIEARERLDTSYRLEQLVATLNHAAQFCIDERGELSLMAQYDSYNAHPLALSIYEAISMLTPARTKRRITYMILEQLACEDLLSSIQLQLQDIYSAHMGEVVHKPSRNSLLDVVTCCDQLVEQYDAATVIQATARGLSVRGKCELKYRSASAIQAAVRGLLTRAAASCRRRLDACKQPFTMSCQELLTPLLNINMLSDDDSIHHDHRDHRDHHAHRDVDDGDNRSCPDLASGSGGSDDEYYLRGNDGIGSFKRPHIEADWSDTLTNRSPPQDIALRLLGGGPKDKGEKQATLPAIEEEAKGNEQETKGNELERFLKLQQEKQAMQQELESLKAATAESQAAQEQSLKTEETLEDLHRQLAASKEVRDEQTRIAAALSGQQQRLEEREAALATAEQERQLMDERNANLIAREVALRAEWEERTAALAAREEALKATVSQPPHSSSMQWQWGQPPLPPGQSQPPQFSSQPPPPPPPTPPPPPPPTTQPPPPPPSSRPPAPRQEDVNGNGGYDGDDADDDDIDRRQSYGLHSINVDHTRGSARRGNQPGRGERRSRDDRSRPPTRRHTISHRLSTGSRTADPSGEPLFAIFIVFVVFDDGVPHSQTPAVTAALTTPEFAEFAISGRAYFSQFSAAFSTVPALHDTDAHSLVMALAQIYGGDNVAHEVVDWDTELHACEGAYRINITLPDGTPQLANAFRKICDVHSYPENDPYFANVLSPLTDHAHLYELLGKTSSLFNSLQDGQRQIVTRLCNLFSDKPFAPTSRLTDQRGRYDSYENRGNVSGSYSNKHLRCDWEKIPHRKIAERLPDWSDDDGTYSIQDHMYNMVVLWSEPGSDYLYELCKEEKPFLTLMQAALTKIKKHVQFYEDPTLNQRVHAALEVFASQSSSAFTQAKGLRSLTDAAGQSVSRLMRSALGEGLCVMRAVLDRHNMEGMATEESTWLMKVCHRGPYESSEDFLARMNISYNRCATLWGHKLLYAVCAGGALNQLLPMLIRQLAPAKQTQAIEYWDSLINTLAKSECLDQMPKEFYAKFVPHLDRIKRRQPTKSDLCLLGEAIANDPSMFSGLATTVERSTCNVTFTGAEDLDWIAPVGLLVTHWDAFMSGMYTRTTAVFTRTAVTFSQMHAGTLPLTARISQVGADGSAKREPPNGDECSDDSGDEGDDGGWDGSRGGEMAAVDTRATRNQAPRGRTAARRPSAPSAPAKKHAPSAPSERVDGGKAGYTLDSIMKRMDALATRLDQMHAEGVHANETWSKQLHNIANHTTDLRHATALREMANKQSTTATVASRRAGVSAMAERKLRQEVGKRPAAKPGWKLEDRFQALKYVKLSSAARAALSTALGIKDAKDFDNLQGECVICKDNHNERTWPHRIQFCPKLFAGTNEAADKLSAATIERSRMLVEKALSSKAGVQALLECFDNDDDEEHYDAVALCVECVQSDVEDMDVDPDDAETWLCAASEVMRSYRSYGPFYK